MQVRKEEEDSSRTVNLYADVICCVDASVVFISPLFIHSNTLNANNRGLVLQVYSIKEEYPFYPITTIGKLKHCTLKTANNCQ